MRGKRISPNAIGANGGLSPSHICVRAGAIDTPTHEICDCCVEHPCIQQVAPPRGVKANTKVGAVGRCTGAAAKSFLTAVEEVLDSMSRGISPNLQQMTSNNMQKVSVRLQYLCTATNEQNKELCGEPALQLLMARNEKLLTEGALTLNDLESVQPFEFLMSETQKSSMETMVKNVIDSVRKVVPANGKKRSAKHEDEGAGADDIMDLFS